MDYDYLTRRMNEERQRAAEAESSIAREAHLELADHYAKLIERLSTEDDSGMQSATT